METVLFPSVDRGTKDIGWLRSNFVFSFSNYYNPVKSAFGTLFAFNDDYLQVGKGFGIHPHINMEIISILLKGKMNHKDTMGYSTVIEEGGVQIMSAGSGLKHEEYNIGEENVNFLQIWIYPKQQNISPRYQTRSFPKAQRKNQLVTIISSEEGLAHCWINQNAKLSLGYFEKGQQINYQFRPENMCLFVFNISGDITVNGQPVPGRDAIGIWDTDKISIDCNEESEFLIIETVINQK
ncbi:pirin family protein [Niabella yanshanensis]|uniref:Pirin family protein n=1 Tax=Niabella yanshanensis TaxID=577386 RepID=A0ABZ0W9B6_9BACT|nr:pirin family protein [Niabella yanshanensis]WQD39878.1 pirin family protein [Niabella yanshanensis]